MSIICEHLVEDHGFSRAEAKAALSGWELQPILQRGEQVGELMLRGNEVHFALASEYRLKLGRRDLIKQQLDKLLEHREFLVTKLFKGDKHRALIVFMGFRKTHEYDGAEYFWLDRETRNDLHKAA